MNSDYQPAQSALAVAIQWLQATLLGSLATGIAVIAVAAIGFLLFSGRVDVRRSIQVIFGCFILFGASSIASGIIHAVSGGTAESAAVSLEPSPPLQTEPLAQSRRQPAVPYDPYAGAALPTRR